MAPTGIVTSIQIGQPQVQGTGSEAWTTAIYKESVPGPVRFDRESIVGDAVADHRYHGGLDKAVLAYSADHYATWQSEWGSPPLPAGAFGENLSIRGLTEKDVCLGDIWSLGEVILQVSQPRQPCWKLARRWERPDLPKQVQQTGRSGWYLRVLCPGFASVGSIELQDRPYPEWPITRCNQVAYTKGSADTTRADRSALASLPLLSEAWRDWLTGRE